mmetsp:Transcript_1534/g.1746  ORF Transcript_1534/g.1746 Transcript_1534/m.1746 type:complete len:262 (+) Transcript_1534:101-886(+)
MAENSRKPRLTLSLSFVHVFYLLSMFTLFLVGSIVYPTIDQETLKPGPLFPKWLKSISYYSNIPIKYGAVHLSLYALEFYRSPSLFTRHIGQRLTTLWFQVFQHPRWGQHLHMQTETLLQVVDVHSLASFRKAELDFCKTIGGLMLFTNLITSSAYHTFKEQAIGFFFTLLKLVGDYSKLGHDINHFVGSVLGRRETLAFGLAFATFLFCVVKYILAHEPLTDFLAHPTVSATAVVSGGAIADRLESKPGDKEKKDKNSVR